MPFAAALSTLSNAEQACEQVCSAVCERVPKPELGILFFSPQHVPEIVPHLATVSHRLGACKLIGCVGEAIVSGDREIEHEAALSLWAADWQGRVAFDLFHLSPSRTPDGWSLLGWPDAILDGDPAHSAMLILGDPYTFPADQLFLPRVNEDYRGLRVVGGNASGSPGRGHTLLVVESRVESIGAVGVLLRGEIKMRTVVSQGCRPIGRPLVITKAQETLIQELGGQSPLDQLRAMWPQLTLRDQDLVRRGLHLGIVINEYQENFNRGDFLVRNLYGIDQESGAIAVMDHVRVGQTVQFHVRDADSADEDLRQLLQHYLAQNPKPPAGGLLFTCNGRGTRLFAAPHHDAALIQSEVGAFPVSGFFAAGEYGPIGGNNYIHGFTASIALFDD